MPSQKQAKGQRRKEGIGVGHWGTGKPHYFEENHLESIIGRIPGAKIASLLLTELDPCKLVQPGRSDFERGGH
jgi:hypothetical protein